MDGGGVVFNHNLDVTKQCAFGNVKMFHLHELVLWFGSDFLVEAVTLPEATREKK
ncbi:hypothetical protein A2U01_0032410, partial [Trifolium medium]|nr:hypothetical protein [Trifolium medium]